MDAELKKMTQEVEQLVGKNPITSTRLTSEKMHFSFFRRLDPKLIYPGIFAVVFFSLAVLKPSFVCTKGELEKKKISFVKLFLFSSIIFCLIASAYYFALANSKFLNM